MKRILVTGGAGFVGINLVEYLLKNSEMDISIIDNLSTGNQDLLNTVVASTGKTVHFFQGDIREKEKVRPILEDMDFVVHLAAQTGVIPSINNPVKDAEVNIMGTLNLLEAAAGQGVERFIFASSAAPLGEQAPPLDELKIPRPLSPYGASKLAGEAYCSAFSASFGLTAAVLRFSNLYGPNSYHKGSVVAKFMKRILRQQPLIIYGDGTQTRDFLYAADLGGIILSILQAPREKIAGETFQLGTGKETSIQTLVRLLEKVTRQPVSPVYEPARKGEIKRNYTSPQKIEKVLGIKAGTDLETGLRQTWKWFVNNASGVTSHLD